MDSMSIRFPDVAWEELDALVEAGVYADRSEAMREAWREWRERHSERIRAVSDGDNNTLPPVSSDAKADSKRRRALGQNGQDAGEPWPLQGGRRAD